MATMARPQANEEEFLSALYKGGELLAAGKIVDARAHLEKANQLSPKNEKAQNLLGLTYFKLGLFDEASDIYERLVRENPVDPTLRVNLGLVYLKTNNLPRCIKEFETATDLDPEHKKAHNYLGLALAQAGDYGKAREHFVLSGSEQMAEKMSRALAAKVETTPAMVLPSAPPATAHAVTARPAEVLPTVDVTRPPPLPPPPAAEEEIEVMSDEEVVSGELAMPAEPPAPPPPPPEPPEPQLIETEPMPVEVEVEVPPPAPSGPRLERDWGAQFGMDDAPRPGDLVEASPSAEIEVTEALPVTEASSEELPVIEANAEIVSTQKRWSAPMVNSWDAASGMTPPARDAVVSGLPPQPVEQTMESTHDPAADDPMWHAAKSAVVEQQPPAQDMSWNVPPDPAQELDFGGVAPTDAVEQPAQPQPEPALAEQAYQQTSTDEAYAGQPPSDASSVEPYAEQPYAEQSYGEQSYGEQSYAEQPNAEQPNAEHPNAEQPYTEQPYTEQPYTEQPYTEQPSAEQSYAEQSYAEQPYSEQPQTAMPADRDASAEPAPEQQAQSWDEQPTVDAPPQEQPWADPPTDGALSPYTDSPTEPYGRMTSGDAQVPVAAPAEPTPGTEPPPPDQAWVAQPLSQFSPDTPPEAPRPPPSAPQRYSPMQARTLVELGETTSDIEQPNAGPFHVGPQGLAISVNGQMLSRMSNLVAIVGSVTATPEPKRARGRATEQPFGDGANQVQRLEGHGVVHLEMGGARFHALDLNDESAYLREERVFGFEETVGFEHGTLSDEAQKLRLDLVHLSGDGRVLLQLGGAMKALAIPAGEPMVVPLQRLVGWFGRVSPRLTGFAGQGAVELTGEGYALLVTPG